MTLILGFAPAAFATSVTASPTSCTEVSISGGNSWSNTGNAKGSDGSYATATVDDNEFTNYLNCTGFGFSIPSNATITGITVNVERQTSSTNSGSVTSDYRVRVVKGGVIGTTDGATGTSYTTSDVIEAHGGAANLWGATWAPADINASNFGTAYAAQKSNSSGGARTISVDQIQVTVDYTAPFSCTQPANTPSGMALTCVCDTFARATLQPSTIFNSNWIVSTSDSTGILPSIANSGYLRLTDNTGNNAKAATVPGIFPASGNYISVEFQHYAYNGSGADGIAVTLSDYSVPAVPGAFGGSLGYAQRSGVNGFAGGWLGVALDEFGNYSNPTEGRIGGTAFVSQAVGARGSGSGQTGYQWLGGTASLTPTIDNHSSTTPSPGYIYQIIVDARNEPTKTAVTVNRDTGSGYSSLISIPNVYTAATANGFTQAPVPNNWQLSFTGSTGGSTNIHEISNLRICAQNVYPPGGGAASGFSAIDDSYGTPPAVVIQNYLTGHIFMKLVGTPFRLNVAAINNSQILTTYASSSTKNVTVKLVDNSDGACVLDSSKPSYCSLTCTGKSAVSGGSQTLPFTSSDKGQKQSADFTLNSAYRNLAAIISDGTTTACSTDVFSVRPTGISSVTSSNATNSAPSGTPFFKAGADPFAMTLTTVGVGNVAGGYTGLAKINNTAILPVSPATAAGVVVPATFPTATSGTGSSVAIGATFTYSEVGTFILPGYDPLTDTKSLRGVYDGVQTAIECSSLTVVQCDSLKLSTSWTGVDSVSTVNDCISDSYNNTEISGRFGCNFGLTSNTLGFGRFVPNEFVVTSAVLTNRPAAACSTASYFSYLDEGMGLQITLEARAGGGNVTANYAGVLAKLALTSSALAFGAAATSPSFTALTSRISATGFTGAWPDFTVKASDRGKVTLSGTVTVSSLTLPSANRALPDGPFTTVPIGIAPVEPNPDVARILNYDLDTDNSGGASGPDHKTLGTTTLYFGQLRLLPAIGSERLPLAMRAEMQRWSGVAFVPNGDDSCTQIPFTRLGLSSWTKNLSAGETAITSGALSMTSGVGTIRLSAPGAGNDGSVTVTTDVNGAGMPYLGGHWAGAAKYNQNPSAVAGFGLYKGSGPVIHFRENY